MLIGLIGFGYWGRILRCNLQKFVDSDIIIHDPAAGIQNSNKISDCDKVFVATNSSSHFDIVKGLLENGQDVFCEKPLCLTLAHCKELYKTAASTNSKLFVDWTFTFNDAVNHIKKGYESGRYGGIRSVSMNRLNSGPERKDTSAKWDLASHDVSILDYIFSQKPNDINWNPFKRNSNSFVSDSCVGLLKYDGFDALLHSSWEYSKKDRMCVFEFDAGFLTWDDNKNTLDFNGGDDGFIQSKSPLENSILTFLNDSCGYNQEELTLNVTEVLEYGE
tara:strand:- start:4224 stop:5051 length:828 start_codon:yes stop_codon:yes gene_type:complete